MFKISAIRLRAGPTRWKNSSGPGQTELVQKFLLAGPTWADNYTGPGLLRPKNLPGRTELGRKFLRAGSIDYQF